MNDLFNTDETEIPNSSKTISMNQSTQPQNPYAHELPQGRQPVQQNRQPTQPQTNKGTFPNQNSLNGNSMNGMNGMNSMNSMNSMNGIGNMNSMPDINNPNNLSNMNDMVNMGQNSHKKLLVIACIVIAVAVIILYIPQKLVPPKPIEEQTLPEPVYETIVPETNLTDYDIRNKELESTEEFLDWVNYTKASLSNEKFAVSFVIHCSSATLGKFDTVLTYEDYIQLNDSGILPLSITVYRFSDGTTCYSNFKLKSNWKELLNGK